MARDTAIKGMEEAKAAAAAVAAESREGAKQAPVASLEAAGSPQLDDETVRSAPHRAPLQSTPPFPFRGKRMYPVTYLLRCLCTNLSARGLPPSAFLISGVPFGPGPRRRG